jgi:hypothetical protein
MTGARSRWWAPESAALPFPSARQRASAPMGAGTVAGTALTGRVRCCREPPPLAFVMRRIVLCLVLLPVLVRCGNDAGGPSQPTVPNIAGAWNWEYTFGDEPKGVSCSEQGTIDIDQTGSTFSATITSARMCTLPSGPLTTPGDVATSAGQISGQNISFRVEPLCGFEGTLSGTPPNAMNGTSSCTPAFFQDIGDTISLSGTWQTTR